MEMELQDSNLGRPYGEYWPAKEAVWAALGVIDPFKVQKLRIALSARSISSDVLNIPGVSLACEGV